MSIYASIVARSPRPDSASAAHFGADDIGWQALGPAIACTVLASTFVALRWHVRRSISCCLGCDDVLISLSLVRVFTLLMPQNYMLIVTKLSSWAMTAVVAAETSGGKGAYAGTLSTETIVKLIVTSNILWILSVNTTKASILVQYFRIFSDRFQRAICWTLMLLLLPTASWAAFGGLFACQPVVKLWRPEIPGHCMDAQNYWLSVAGIDIGLDFLVLLLPLPAILRLRLPRKQKTALVTILLLGFAVCVFSVVRLSTVLITANEGDFVASSVWAIVWSAVEANVGIICASLLSLKPLLPTFNETCPPRHSMQLPYLRPLDESESSAMQYTGQSPNVPSTAFTLCLAKGTFYNSRRQNVSSWLEMRMPKFSSLERPSLARQKDREEGMTSKVVNSFQRARAASQARQDRARAWV